MTVGIYLEAHEVGASGYGHLYLVKKDGADPNDTNQEAEVIRGGLPRFGWPLELSVETRELNLSQDSYAETNSHISIDITDLFSETVDETWATLNNVAVGLTGLYTYIVANPSEGGYTANSNATILTVLNSVGVDVRTLIGELNQQEAYDNGYPGVTPFENGGEINHYATLLGSGTTELIEAHENLGDTGLVFYGRDETTANGDNDFVDRIIGTDGNDFIYARGGGNVVVYGGLASCRVRDFTHH